MNQKNIIKKFFSFSLVGLVITIFSALLIYFFIKIFKFNVYFTYSLIYFLSIIISYILNARYTFDDKIKKNVGIKYFLNYVFSMVLGMIIIKITDMLFIVKKEFLGIIPIPLTLLWNFLISNFVLFTSNRNFNYEK